MSENAVIEMVHCSSYCTSRSQSRPISPIDSIRKCKNLRREINPSHAQESTQCSMTDSRSIIRVPLAIIVDIDGCNSPFFPFIPSFTHSVVLSCTDCIHISDRIASWDTRKGIPFVEWNRRTKGYFFVHSRPIDGITRIYNIIIISVSPLFWDPAKECVCLVIG